MNILDRINKPNDIKDIDREDLPELADEIREFLVSHVSETGGHLAPNLGCVELTMALHRVLDFPEDMGCGTSVLCPQDTDGQEE